MRAGVTERARASSVSRVIAGGWAMWRWDENGNPSRETFPTCSQAGDGVLVEGDPPSLGWAMALLLQTGRYRVVPGGQWLTADAGCDDWNGWLEVFRG